MHGSLYFFAHRFVEKVVRERFAVAMSRGLTELRIKKPTQSPINGLIQNAVIEVGYSVSSVNIVCFEKLKIFPSWTVSLVLTLISASLDIIF